MGETLVKPSLCYHLSELERTKIMVQSGYGEEGGGAPEKLWKLKTREIRIGVLGFMSPEVKGDVVMTFLPSMSHSVRWLSHE